MSSNGTNQWNPVAVLNIETGEWERRGMMCRVRVRGDAALRRLRRYLKQRENTLANLIVNYDSPILFAELDQVVQHIEEIDELLDGAA